MYDRSDEHMVSVISRAIRPVNVARMVLGALLAAIMLTPGVAMAAPSTTALYHRHICGPASVGFARCHAIVRTDRSGAPAVTTTPSGYGPAALQSAYALPSATNGAGQVFAIVDAYDDPNAASDLSSYRATFGLGPCSSSGSSPCFRKVNQTGGTRMPHANGGWAQETLARSRHGERDLPALPRAARRGVVCELRRPEHSRRHRREPRGDRRVEQLRWQRVRIGSHERVALPSPRRCHYREQWRQRLRGELPRGFAVRDGRWWHVIED